MTTHERWIVYPLLFLTLGIALRPKITGGLTVPEELAAPRVRCETLTVIDANGRPQIRLSSKQGEPRIALFGAGGKTVVELEGYGGGTSGRMAVRQALDPAALEISSAGLRGQPVIVRVDTKGRGEVMGGIRVQTLPAQNAPQPVQPQATKKQNAAPRPAAPPRQP